MEVNKILISKIVPSPMNPRKTIGEEELAELAKNIKKQGLLQPITVRPIEYYDGVDQETGDVVTIPTKYEIVCGERRYRAVKLNAVSKDVEISCIVREMSNSEAFDAMITENLQRKDVDPIEEAFAFGKLKERGQDAKSISLKFGKSERYIQDRIKLSQLTEDCKKAVQDGRLPLSGAIMIAKLDNDKQDEFIKARKGNISVSDVRTFIDFQMRDLTKAPWVGDDTWDIPGITPCNNCLCNTLHYGCLFWEMKSEKPRCTNASCYRHKQEHFVIRELFRNNFMVKKGEPLEFGKIAIVDNGLMSSGAASEFKEKIGATYEIVPESYFDGKSFYDVDDERVAEGLENHTMYMGVHIYDYNGPCFKLQPYKVKVKESTSSKVAAEPKEVKIELLEKKKNSIRLDMQEQSIERCKSLLRERSYFKIQGNLSVVEQLVLDTFMLRKCSMEFRSLYGVERQGEFEFAQTHQAERMNWIRDFIRMQLSSEEYTSDKAFRDSLMTLIHEQYPEDFKAIGSDIATKAQKKIKKIEAQIAELE